MRRAMALIILICRLLSGSVTVLPEDVARMAEPLPSPTAAADPAPADAEPDPTPASAYTYVLNTNSHKFHEPSCPSVDDMKESNKQIFTGTRDEVVAMGYEPCGRCKP